LYRDQLAYRYLIELKAYLEGFFARVKPLSNLDEIRKQTEHEFNARWQQGKFPGWERQIGQEELASDLFCVACTYWIFFVRGSYLALAVSVCLPTVASN